MRRSVHITMAAALVLAVLPATTAAAASETYTVTKTGDTADGTCDADCSLREAIGAANANPGHDTIVLPAGTYELTITSTNEDANADGDLDILDDVTIHGADMATTIIDGGGDFDGADDDDDRVLDADIGVALGLMDLTVTGGDPPASGNGNGGGLFMADAGVLSLDRVTFEANRAPSQGGGVYMDDGGVIRIENSSFTGNRANGSNGGGLHYSEGSLVLRDSDFDDNYSGNDGGGIAMNNETTALVWDSTFTNNEATTDGGGIGLSLNSYGGLLQCWNCEFRDNLSGNEGGGLMADSNESYVELHDPIFENNTAEGDGGGLFIDESYVLVEGGRFDGNQAYEHGGAIGGEEMVLVMRDVDVTNNRAFDTDSPTDETTGGGISNEDDYGDILLERVLLEGNSATHAGGGLYLYETSVVIRESIFRDNVVDARGTARDAEGGAIGETNESRLVVERTLFEGNVAIGDQNAEGGVMRLEEGPAVFIDSTFRDNRAETTYDVDVTYRAMGGAFFVEDEATPHQFEESLFEGNMAVAPDTGFALGGAIYAEDDGTAVATNSTFSGNSASTSGGAFHGEDDGRFRAQSSTFVSNTAGDGQAIYLAADDGSGPGHANVKGSLFEGHVDDTCAGEAIVSNGWNLVDDTTCDLDEPSDLDDTVAGTLSLADNGGLTMTHAITEASPALDAGAASCTGAAGVFALTTDQRGANRPVDGDNDTAAACDIGAFEYQAAVTVVATDADAAEKSTGSDDGTGTFTFSRPGTDGDLIVAYTVSGTATPDADYPALTGEVMIADGDASATVLVTPVDDGSDEGAETVIVTLTEAVDYTVGTPATATVTITDAPAPAIGGTRVFGDTRSETAVAVSNASYGDDAAGAVVLARSDTFPDALAGTPLAAAVDAPILLTSPTVLEPAVATEIDRVLADGGRIYLLGGRNALDPAIEAALEAAGYDTKRLAGADRVATSIAIAGELGDPGTILVTTGANFPDALAAGAAAAAVGGSVVLTTSDVSNAATDAYLAARSGATVYAIGGPAARAHPSATPVVGATRAETGVKVAEEFFDDPTVMGLAVSTNFPDALAGGAHMARLGGPLLLSNGTALDGVVNTWICANAPSLTSLYVYGGVGAVSADVFSAAAARIDGTGC